MSNMCNRAYIGQTGRNLTLRYREHIRYIKKQRSPVRLCTGHPAKHTWIWFPQRHHATTQTNPQNVNANSLWTATNPNFPSKWKPHSWTQLWRTKLNISVSYRLQPYITTCPQPHLPHDPHKPVLTKPCWNLTQLPTLNRSIPTTRLAQTSPDQATLEGSSCTSMWVFY